ncbi:uncharacterized protein LOC131672624 isoform X2 [Phymastichus coffea]|uniref:uncharacterized protein LOC131672624 isoform X2 n=1 Tax=Phymastichus coffea TaxID=108790 RepID=UPI00273CA7D6|nr:uncharacterized protein LOC131672624 isoform X2 [Phymastichus coffea]
MKLSSLVPWLFLIIIGFVVLAKVDDAKLYDRADTKATNAAFRSCIRECVKIDSRDGRTDYTVCCTRKYRLRKPRRVIS